MTGVTSPTLTPTLPRWYLGYRARHKKDLVKHIVDFVQGRALGDTICGLRMEKHPSHGQVYFFLTIESDEWGVLPETIDALMDPHPILRKAQYIQGQHVWALHQLEEKGFVGSEVKVKALGQYLPYPALRSQGDEDPLGSPEEPEETSLRAEGISDAPFTALPALSPSEQHERFLWWLTARGSGSWATLRDTAECLRLGGEREPRRQLRRLRLLGHLETSKDGQRWAVTPPGVVTTPTPTGELRFLTGGRVSTLLTNGERDGNPGAPDRARVTHVPPYVEDLGFAGHILAHAMPDLQAWLHSLPVVDSVIPANYRFKRFVGGTWQDSRANQPGFYELTHRKVAREQRTTLFFDGDRWRRGDWYGLRYAALHAAGDLQGAKHDLQTWQLAWPSEQRPPEVYERSLVLSSGLLPRQQGAWLLYDNVHPEVTARVAAGLGMPLEQR